MMPSLLQLFCLFFSLDAVRSQNVACMTLHCFIPMTECFSNSDCKNAIGCLGSCGSNQTCAIPCLATYENQRLDNFLYCAVTKHNCIKLPVPNPPFECKPPSAPPVKNFTLEMFSGKWHVLLGLNRNYDCFDCQLSTYSAVPDTHNYTLTERYVSPTLNHSIRAMAANMSAEVKNPLQGGMVSYSGLENGLVRAELWRILVYDNVANYSVINYCGKTGSWRYEGTLVYSRQPVLTASNMAKLKADMKSVGYNMDEFCTPKTQNCSVQ